MLFEEFFGFGDPPPPNLTSKRSGSPKIPSKGSNAYSDGAFEEGIEMEPDGNPPL